MIRRTEGVACVTGGIACDDTAPADKRTGQQVLDYLGRYVFRVAISNSRLERVADRHVTFRCRDNRTRGLRRVTLTGVEFIGRFLQHVLPRGCAKVRYYRLWSASRRADLAQARDLLSAAAAKDGRPPAPKPQADQPGS
ncbi:MAG TPA: transposase [Vicinamibacterales bacterium]|nr:transposase [Vicinamibacterales bacterium]